VGGVVGWRASSSTWWSIGRSPRCVKDSQTCVPDAGSSLAPDEASRVAERRRTEVRSGERADAVVEDGHGAANGSRQYVRGPVGVTVALWRGRRQRPEDLVGAVPGTAGVLAAVTTTAAAPIRDRGRPRDEPQPRIVCERSTTG
jgi:hypothetical protein